MSLISPSTAKSEFTELGLSTWSYFPLTTPIAFPKYLIFGNPKYRVKNMALKTNNTITNGAPLNTSKNTTFETKSEKGLKALSIF